MSYKTPEPFHFPLHLRFSALLEEDRCHCAERPALSAGRPHPFPPSPSAFLSLEHCRRPRFLPQSVVKCCRAERCSGVKMSLLLDMNHWWSDQEMEHLPEATTLKKKKSKMKYFTSCFQLSARLSELFLPLLFRRCFQHFPGVSKSLTQPPLGWKKLSQFLKWMDF